MGRLTNVWLSRVKDPKHSSGKRVSQYFSNLRISMVVFLCLTREYSNFLLIYRYVFNSLYWHSSFIQFCSKQKSAVIVFWATPLMADSVINVGCPYSATVTARNICVRKSRFFRLRFLTSGLVLISYLNDAMQRSCSPRDSVFSQVPIVLSYYDLDDN